MVTLKALLGKYPHTEPLLNKQVTSPLVTLDIAPPNGRLDFKAFVQRDEFDVGELALIPLLQARALGKPLVLLPAVLMARHQHRCICVCADETRIATPKDLEGKLIGLRSDVQTGAVWALGILANEYSVDISQLNFLIFEEPHVAEHQPQPNVKMAPAGKELVQMLLDGEVDAIIGDLEAAAQPGICLLLQNPEQAERRYYETHGIVPVGHVLAASSKLPPEIIQEVFRMFSEAKQIGGRTQDGVDFHPFGTKALNNALEMMINYAWQQKLITRRLTVDEVYGDTVRSLGL